MINRVCKKIKLKIWEFAHRKWEQKLRSKLTNRNVTIISCNCTGGVMYHDLGMQFLSPTVNLFMNANDYIKFCEDLPRYIKAELTQYKGKVTRDYPMANLDGLTIYLVHYKSLEEAKQKWEERAKRINWDNIVIIGTDRDGMTMDLMERFNKLPYPKVMFVKNTPIYPWQVQMQGCMEKTQVGTILHPDISSWVTAFRGKRYYDQFDWVDFFNNIKELREKEVIRR